MRIAAGPFWHSSTPDSPSFPSLSLLHSYSYANYTTHSNAPLEPKSEQVLKRADALLMRSALYSRDSHHDIFLCNNNALYNLFYLWNGKTPTPSHPPTRICSMSNLVTLEVVLNLVRERLGLIRSEHLAIWKNESSTEYVSMFGRNDYKQALVQEQDDYTAGEVSTPSQSYLDRILNEFVEDHTITFEEVLKLH